MISRTYIAIFLVLVLLSLPSSCVKNILTFELEQAKIKFDKIFCNQCYGQDCNYNKERIAISQTNYFTSDIIKNNKLGITRINAYKGEIQGDFNFPKTQLKNQSMGYAAFLPNVQKLQGVVLYFHGTILGTKDIPTNFGDDYLAIGSLFTSQGYATIIPNNIGYQLNPTGPPPPRVLSYSQTIMSSILALNDFYKALLTNYTSKNSNGSFDLHVMGFSEGAQYSIHFQSCYQYNSCQNQTATLVKNVYNFKSVVGMSGPYSLRNVTFNYLTSEVGKVQNNQFSVGSNELVNFNKPGMIIGMLSSLTQYDYKARMQNYTQRLFYNMVCDKAIKQNRCNNQLRENQTLQKALKSNQNSITISKQIAFSAFNKKLIASRYLSGQPIQLDGTGYANGYINNVISYISQELLLDPFFLDILSKRQAMKYLPNAPTYIFHLKYDSSVSPLNSINYLRKYKSSTNLKSYEFSNINHQVCRSSQTEIFQVDHVGSQILGIIFGLKFIQNT